MTRTDRDQEFELAVIGGGSAGFAASIRAAEEGLRVALINAGTIGGTCVNLGCIPSKALIRAAEANHQRAHHPFEGVATAGGDLDWQAVRSQKDALVESLRQAKYVDVLAGYSSVSLFNQNARLEHAVEPVVEPVVELGTETALETAIVAGVDAERGFPREESTRILLEDGTSIITPRVVITTGASPSIPDIPGLSDVDYLDSTSVMELDALPSTMIVLGAGSVALELAQAFARFGVQVTVLSRSSHILSKQDPDLGNALVDYLRSEGLTVHTGLRVTGVEQRGTQKTVGFQTDGGIDRSVSADCLLIATGRRPNTAGLGLEEAGVALGPGGEIEVDEFLQTTNPSVYAAGDVTGEPMHVYVAAQDASRAVTNALHGNTEAVERRAVPAVVFTDPAVAVVGLTEAQAREEGGEVITSLLPLEHVPRSLAAQNTRGFIKLVAEAQTRRIIGAQILASEAGEMIMEPTLAVKHGLTIDDLTSILHPYLTLAEGVKLAAQAFDKSPSELSCCAA